MRKKGKKKNTKPIVPAYVVTFSDMVTLLLTFFVMLLSVADATDVEIFNRGRWAFIKSIETLGLETLSKGWRNYPDLGYKKNKYSIKVADDCDNTRTFDALEEEKRQMFAKVQENAVTMESQIVSQKTTFTATRVSFEAKNYDLDTDDKNFLKELAAGLEQVTSNRSISIFVLGLANENITLKEKWLISSRRALAVTDYLRKAFKDSINCPVYGWGAGSGGQWISDNSPVSSSSQIWIAILNNASQ